MKNVVNRLKQNRIGVAGVLVSFVMGGIETLGIWMGGPNPEQKNSPIGIALIWLAERFTNAPSSIQTGSDRAELTYWLFVCAYFIITCLFAALLWHSTYKTNKRSNQINSPLLALQLLIGLLSNSILLFLFSANLAVVLPLRSGLKWLALQLFLYGPVVFFIATRLVRHNADVKLVILVIAAEMLTQAFIFAGACVATREWRGRMALAVANAELLATQSLLKDTIGASERMRIARDLHDVLGHQLTALNLHLELALRQTETELRESLHTSSALAHALLSEVRLVVSAERRDQSIDLRRALEVLCSGIPVPKVRLVFDDKFDIFSPIVAHVLFCCMQEAITNAVRHSDADVVTIDFVRDGESVVVSVCDNGSGRRHVTEGNGLRGMRERLAQVGGILVIDNQSQRGFTLNINLPFTEGLR